MECDLRAISVLTVMTLGVWLVPSSSIAQQITNLRTTNVYDDLAAAVAGSMAGDTLEVSGTVTGSALVDRDLVFVAASQGATLQSTGDFIFDLVENVSLTVDGVELIGLSDTRAINAPDGGNTIEVRGARIESGGVDVNSGEEGGAVFLSEPDEVVFTNVVFVGTAGAPQAVLGGAIWAYTTFSAPLTMTGVRFEQIEATSHGGAIWVSGMATSCVGCIFNHTEGGFGGAIYSERGSLYVERSLFCSSDGTLGGAIFSSSETDIRATIFQENTAFSFGGALYANGGRWTAINNHFVGNGGKGAFYAANLPTITRVTNNLFLGNTTLALDLDVNAQPTERYNWFYDNAGDSTRPLDSTNITDGGAPGIVSWTFDDNCTDDELWPAPITSPLLDAGDPAIEDPDGSRSDIGAYGGTWADPRFHEDGDGDGAPFLQDCDDTDGGSYPGADELCDDIDHNCDGDPRAGAISSNAFYEDLDGDGYGTEETQLCADAPPDGLATSSGDCQDEDPSVNPAAEDACGDGIDQDCNGGDGDDQSLQRWFPDQDGDGFGDPDAPPVLDCRAGAGAGLVNNNIDCDDADPDRTLDCLSDELANGCNASATRSPPGWLFIVLAMVGLRRLGGSRGKAQTSTRGGLLSFTSGSGARSTAAVRCAVARSPLSPEGCRAAVADSSSGYR